MRIVAISTSTFGKFNEYPIQILERYGLDVKLNPYGRKIQKEEILEFCKDAVGLIAGTETIDREVIENLSILKVISRCGVGMDNIDIEAIKEKGIALYNTPYGPVLPVAELTVGLMLNVLRHISLMDRELRGGIWKKRMGGLLKSKKVGIVGLGRIGATVADMIQAFGIEVAYYDINNKIDTVYQRMEFIELIKWADILTLHCQAKANSHYIIGQDELKQMKESAILINSSRGELVDENALYYALKNNKITGAAIDVYHQEPYSGKLKDLPNIVITPHIGSYAKEARVDMEISSVENLIEGLKEKGAL